MAGTFERRLLRARLQWAAAAGAAMLVMAAPASAQTFGSCTVSAANVNLGNLSSLTLASQSQESSGSSGLACSALAVATDAYIKLRVDSSTFQLTGAPSGQTVPFIVSATSNGTAIPVGAEFDFSAFGLLGLFTGPGSSVPIYVKTSPTPGMQAGTYTGSVTLRWYFSICSLGVVTCLSYSNSPGVTRNAFGVLTNWGAGAPVTINVTLTVENDCAITAPDLNFGVAPLVGSFSPVNGTIAIRCSAGAAYTVGLSDGANFSGGWRRMRRGATGDYLRYEIYQTPSSSDRWGSIGAQRRASTTAQTNPGVYDGAVSQGFTYRGVIDPTQATPPVGLYVDNIVLDVVF